MLLDVAPEQNLDAPPKVRSGGAWRAVCSFPVVLAALLIVLTVLTVRSRFSDPDMWWHLKTGEIIWNTHQIPTVDLFSFTTNGHAYVPHEWLAQLTIYAAYHLGSYTGLMLWFCLLTSLLTIGAYVLCAFYSGNVKVAFVGGLITWLFSTVGLSIRPHMIGYVLLVCELLVIHLGRSRNPRWFFVLPPLFAIWVNCHGSFGVGLLLLGIALICSMIELHWGLLRSRRWEKRRRNTLALAFLLSAAALFINPAGLTQITYPFDTIANQQVQMRNVSEWQPPHLDDARTLALLAVAALILLLPLIRRAELRVQELLFVILGFGLAVQHERMLLVFGVIAAPVLCRLLANTWEGYDPDRDRPMLNGIALAILALVVWLAFPGLPQLESQVEAGNPVKAVRFLNHSGLSGRMLNEYVYGGYLIWAAPQHKVFIDGRGDIFEWTGVLTDYGKWMTLQADPTVLLDHYHIDFCLLSRNAPMARVMPFMRGWKTVYSDSQSIVFARQS